MTEASRQLSCSLSATSHHPPSPVESIQCRACGCEPLHPVLSLGDTPLANALLTADQLHDPEPLLPLQLAVCRECTLLQITHTVPPEALFRHYAYFSSVSDELVRHARMVVERVVRQRGLGPEHLVVEIASNDGYLLQHYKRLGVPTLGIDPAENIAQVAVTDRGINTLREFFTADLATQLAAAGRRADVIHAHNVLAHVPLLNDFVQGIAALLKHDGVAIIEVPYACDMLDRCEFDTIYHEHVFYFTLTAVDSVLTRHRLVIRSVEHLTIHGGSLRVFVGHAQAPSSLAGPEPSVALMLADEAARQLGRPSVYEDFASRAHRVRADLRSLLAKLKHAGKTVAAYGASAKGSTLLSFCGIDGTTLDFVVDRSPAKQGRFTPGSHIPILDPGMLVERMPDHTLLLTWNFLDEILRQQREYRARGGSFIVPVPQLRII